MNALLSLSLDIFAVVRRETINGRTAYRLTVTSKQEVPPYGPPLPHDGLFEDPQLFRKFLVAKRARRFPFDPF